MSTGGFNRIGIDQLSPFPFEGVFFLVVDRGHIQAKDRDGFRIRKFTDDLLGVMNPEEDHFLHHLRGWKCEIKGEELRKENRSEVKHGGKLLRRSRENSMISGCSCSVSADRFAR